MLNIIPTQNNPNTLSYAEKVIYWAIILTPLWWLLGVQVIVYPSIAAFLLIKGFTLDKLIKSDLPLCNWAWLGMSLAALWTNILGFEAIEFNLMTVAATLFTLFKGYLMIFACFTLPFWHRIRLEVISRAVAIMTSSYLITLTVQMLLLAAVPSLKPFLPPFAGLLPGEKLSMMVKPAIIQPFFGIPLPRTDLYTADPPILGVCSLLCFFICLGESNRQLRRLGLLGSFAGLIISQSRLAWVCFPLTFLIIACFRTGLARQVSLWGASFISLVCTALGLSINNLFIQPLETFNSARADSSKDREYVISATLDAWRESPWFGWGVLGKTVSWGNGLFELPLGTFSSYAQVLFLHGILGFLVFIMALISTLFTFWKPSVEGSASSQKAFATLIALYILCHATTLTWMAIYIWFFLIWLGAVIVEIKQKQQKISRWEQLMIHNN